MADRVVGGRRWRAEQRREVCRGDPRRSALVRHAGPAQPPFLEDAAVHELRGAVHAREPGAGAQPRASARPAGDVRRVEQRLPHHPHRPDDRPRIDVRVEQPQRADREFDRALDDCAVRLPRVERVGREHGAHDLLRIEAGLARDVRDRRDDLRFGVGVREELEQLAREVPRRGVLLQDDVDDVVSVEVAGFAQERLASGVVLCRAEDEASALLKAIAGVRARRLPHVLLAVVAGAEREQLHQLTRVVLVRLALLAGVDVEPEHHRRIAHDGLEQYVEPAECVVAEELVLRQHHAVVLLRDLLQARRQQPVPEQRRAFDQRPLGGHETRHPRSDHVDRLLHVEVQVRDGRVGGAVLDRRLAQQIIDHLFERHAPVALDIRGQRDERRAPQQVPQARIGVVERVRSRTRGRLLDRRRTLLRRVRSAAALVHDDAGRRAARRQHRRRGAGAGEEPPPADLHCAELRLHREILLPHHRSTEDG